MQNHQHNSKSQNLIESQRDLYLTNAHTDPLTGALSRRAFESAYAAAEAQYRRNKLAFALFYLDIDHFKKINDTHSHDMGGELLRTLVSTIHHLMRPSDLLIRLGGDELRLFVTTPNAVKRSPSAKNSETPPAKLFSRRRLVQLFPPLSVWVCI